MKTKVKKLKLRPWVIFVLGMLTTLLLQFIIKDMSNTYSNWFHECDQHYGYTTDYYTCRQYHIHKGE